MTDAERNDKLPPIYRTNSTYGSRGHPGRRIEIGGESAVTVTATMMTTATRHRVLYTISCRDALHSHDT